MENQLQEKQDKRIFQFKIILRGITPPIWRRILVPRTYSFWDLHVAIQSAMGWTDSHLHEFEILNPRDHDVDFLGVITEEIDQHNTSPFFSWKKKIERYFSDENRLALYRYDLSDNWEHDIVLEQILPKTTRKRYPQILNGARACPPEDCGGTSGYANFSTIMKNTRHQEYREMLGWYGKKYDAEYWNPANVCFDDPSLRLKQFFAEHAIVKS